MSNFGKGSLWTKFWFRQEKPLNVPYGGKSYYNYHFRNQRLMNLIIITLFVIIYFVLK